MKISVALTGLLGAASLALPLMTFAESNFQTGAGPLTATAHVDFSIVIPQILYLRVGTGSSYTTGVLSPNNITVDEIIFQPGAAVLGNNAPVAATLASGDLGNGIETAAVVGNGGAITLNATAAGAGLADGAGDFIPFTQITTAASTLTTGTFLPAPTLINGTSANVVIPLPASKVIVEDAKWTYAYANNATPPAGTYGGVNTNNSRVVYTATMP